MSKTRAYFEWIGLAAAAVALFVTTIFYFKRVFYSDDWLVALSITQVVSTGVTLVLGLISFRSWKGTLMLLISLISFLGMMYLTVGIH